MQVLFPTFMFHAMSSYHFDMRCNKSIIFWYVVCTDEVEMF